MIPLFLVSFVDLVLFSMNKKNSVIFVECLYLITKLDALCALVPLIVCRVSENITSRILH